MRSSIHPGKRRSTPGPGYGQTMALGSFDYPRRASGPVDLETRLGERIEKVSARSIGLATNLGSSHPLNENCI